MELWNHNKITTYIRLLKLCWYFHYSSHYDGIHPVLYIWVCSALWTTKYYIRYIFKFIFVSGSFSTGLLSTYLSKYTRTIPFNTPYLVWIRWSFRMLSFTIDIFPDDEMKKKTIGNKEIRYNSKIKSHTKQFKTRNSILFWRFGTIYWNSVVCDPGLYNILFYFYLFRNLCTLKVYWCSQFTPSWIIFLV